jgi:hypothetical protein
MAWRRRWAADWENVRWCSEACRRRKVSRVDRALERAMLELLGARSRSASICPSEVARSVAPNDWQRLMEATRRAARRLAAAGRVEITQRGRVVDPSTASGPVRIRRCRAMS